MSVRRLAVAVLLLGLAACGSGQDPAVDAAGTPTTPSTGTTPPPPLSLTVEPLEGLTAGQPVTWRLTLAAAPGQGRSISFPSGQQGEVVLLDGAGAEAYRWSEGMLFAQALTELEVPDGGEVVVELPGTLDVDPGTYALRATVPGAPAPPAVEAQVTVAG